MILKSSLFMTHDDNIQKMITYDVAILSKVKESVFANNNIANFVQDISFDVNSKNPYVFDVLLYTSANTQDDKRHIGGELQKIENQYKKQGIAITCRQYTFQN